MDAESLPSQEVLLKAFAAQERKRKYNVAYMQKYRDQHRDEWNKTQRELYAERKNKKTQPSNHGHLEGV